MTIVTIRHADLIDDSGAVDRVKIDLSRVNSIEFVVSGTAEVPYDRLAPLFGRTDRGFIMDTDLYSEFTERTSLLVSHRMAEHESYALYIIHIFRREFWKYVTERVANPIKTFTTGIGLANFERRDSEFYNYIDINIDYRD